MRENAKTMTLRLNAAEYAHLCQQAEAAGLKKEPFVRTLIMGVNLRPRPPDEYAEIRRQLAAIGNNINQIVKNVNMHYYTDYEKKKLFALMNKIIELYERREKDGATDGSNA